MESLGVNFIFLSTILASVGGICAWWFFSAMGEEVDKAREAQIQSGNTGLSELYISLSPEAFFLLRMALAIVCFVIGQMLIGSILLGLFLAIGGFVAPMILIKKMRKKRVKLIETQLVEGLELMGNSLKSGLTVNQAIELLVKEFPPPINQEFSLLLAETRLGVDLNDALQNMATRLNSTIVFILATGINITKRCGGDLTVIFGNIAQTIREQATIEGKLEAVTAQGRYQGLILSIMPFALMLILWFIDRAHVETLFGYQIGIFAVCAVVVMVIMAQMWINRLLDIDV